MAKSTKLSTRGLNAAMRSLRTQAPAIRDRAGALAAEAMVSEAQVDAPVMTGALKASHGHDEPRKGLRRLFANVVYAAAVHARHPSKAGWFLAAMLRVGPKAIAEGARLALAEAAEKAARAGKSGGQP